MQQILDALCNQHLNLRWRFIESTNTIEIEHYKYFNNSLSYTLAPVIGLDATVIDGGKCLDDTNNYKVQDADYYSEERWYPPIKQADAVQAGVQYGYNWQFWYNCSVLVDKVKKINLTFETNVDACDVIGDSQILLISVGEPDPGFISSFQSGPHHVMNFPFQSGIIHKLWMWNRPFPLGHRIWGQADFAMESTIKSRQNQIEIPICCIEINPYQLVKTDMGNAYIDNWSLEIATGMAKFELKYEDQ